MKANEKTILRFLESSDTKFIIPIYQRRYSWTIEEAKKLYDDLIELIESKSKFHFFGSIVSIYNDIGREREYLIIDGQQRITSISLILIAIYKLINKKVLEAEGFNSEKIVNQYLINQYSTDENKLKLKLKETDFNIYDSLYENDEIDEISNLSINYSYFYNRLLKEKPNGKDFLNAINSLSIVEIELKLSEDKPQLIFESLNSTGKNLTESDKIRNYIFMNKPLEEQNMLYKHYWKLIEMSTGDNTTRFIEEYLMIKEKKVIKKEKLYILFKDYYKKSSYEIEDILKDMLMYVKSYKIMEGSSKSIEINKKLENIKSLEIKAINILLLQIFYDYINKSISTCDVLILLDVIESYLFRRIVCRISNNTLQKLFLNIVNEIKEDKNFKENYVELFKFIILKQVDSLRFPRNIEFKKGFFETDIYRLRTERRLYIFNKLENFDNKEILDLRKLITQGTLTIEHIMPQKLSTAWREALLADVDEIHTKYLHTLGNLTVTGYNSNMSNKSFYEKKTMKKGFKESRLKLNRFIATREQWTEKEIIERSLLLFDDAIKIWKPIQSVYKLTKRRRVLYYLADDEDLTNDLVKGMIFEGIQYNVRSFKEIFDTIINILFDVEPLLITNIAKNSFKIDELSFKISDNRELVKNSYKIVGAIYSDADMNTNVRLQVLRVIFKYYNIDLSELSYYIEKK
ncbi:DUF262 domain-containing protein [uncultured Clostridium sp.]|jgi:uncharacterized protein with ParB-like and HNH nuclease domain|uniref:DUF262 domain-containing protein n=1 Tax=uncultured Clostridium sp. TaxID=59620 RepID=UPI00262C164E|nr:DUF262 domain-containing HNH endonuclease family protein [uncultured Clostridium sp.]